MQTLASYQRFFTQIQKPFRVQHRFWQTTREMTVSSSSIPQIRSAPKSGVEGPVLERQRLEANDESDTRPLLETAVRIEVEEEMPVRLLRVFDIESEEIEEPTSRRVVRTL
jgi:hypothetical protein